MKIVEPKESNEQDELRDALHHQLQDWMLGYLKNDQNLKIVKKDE